MTTTSRPPYTFDDLIHARHEVRPERGPLCPWQVRLSIGCVTLSFDLGSDWQWRLGWYDCYGNGTGAVAGILAPNLVDHVDASGAVVTVDLADWLDASCAGHDTGDNLLAWRA